MYDRGVVLRVGVPLLQSDGCGGRWCLCIGGESLPAGCPVVCHSRRRSMGQGDCGIHFYPSRLNFALEYLALFLLNDLHLVRKSGVVGP